MDQASLKSALIFMAAGCKLGPDHRPPEEYRLEHLACPPLVRPVPGPFITAYCLAAPDDYAKHRQMDTTGGAIIAALAALVTIVIALAVFG